MLNQILSLLLPYLVQIVGSLAIAVALPALLRYTKLHLDDKTRAYLEAAIQNGVKYAIYTVAAKRGITVLNVTDSVTRSASTELQDEVTSMAARYVEQAVPEALGKLGISATFTNSVEQVVAPRLLDIAGKITADLSKTDRLIAGA